MLYLAHAYEASAICRRCHLRFPSYGAVSSVVKHSTIEFPSR